MTRLMKDLLAQRASEAFIGRTEELDILLSVLEGGPRIVFVHGIAGVGKSTLLDEFSAQARTKGAVVVGLDCQTLEPTERGFLHGLSTAIGSRIQSIHRAADRLKSIGLRVIIALDNYEAFRLMDTWLRQAFIPCLPEGVSVVIVGRDNPPLAWRVSPGFDRLVRVIGLGPLSETESIELLLKRGADAESARQISRFAQGHPLALKLAASIGVERRNADRAMTGTGFQRVVEELTRLYLADVGDPLTRRTLDAASVVRRTTLSLLRAMLPDAAPQDVFDRLQALPFVRVERDGLRLDDLVQQAIGSSLRAGDPTTHLEYRRSAWRQLSSESKKTGLNELWRYTADLLYLIENPVVREAFFPSTANQYVVEPAVESDRASILSLCQTHDSTEAARIIERWLNRTPNAFHVVRGQAGDVAGFYLMFDQSAVDSDLLSEDPVIELWWNNLRDDPVPDNQRVLFLRRWLARATGESPSPVQAACWLDIKRTYMEMRPDLRRVYLTVKDLATYAPVARRLCFSSLPNGELTIGGEAYSSAVLDFGPSSVDGWLSRLAASELGLEQSEIFDRQAHELLLDGKKVKLTKLEFDVFFYLYQRKGDAVTRASLIEDVWGWKQTGSNVIESVVRSLRKKLGSRASAIETIRGSGYRIRRL